MNDTEQLPTAREMADRLVRILSVEPVERNFFSGIATPDGEGRVFGGQIIGQAMMAATATIEDDRECHSMHAYFMRPGDATKPVLYQVERDFDGRSFATRRVIAIQQGRPILNFATSFHTPEAGFHHQDDMPDVPPPEDLESEDQLAERYKDKLPPHLLRFMRFNRPVELRPTELLAPFVTDPHPPVQHVWFRTKGPIGNDPKLHRAALAYTSDMGLLGAVSSPHGKTFADVDMQFASLDHALWIHQDFRMDDWMLYAMDSPWSGGARGLARGRIYTRDGQLVANVAQEGLVRHTTHKA
ncbi:acyl-CoA thioesterase II [Aliiroseovarius sp. PTFE2010]|uniref:acyl-CoA thioesterase II n=1 Tax=Aliiroseovarius sp. PTFE2010 TaxID=3417190 RepID=UPI003CF524AE